MTSMQKQSALRHISEDVKLIPFLSQLFDSQIYIKLIIKVGKRNKECFCISYNYCIGCQTQ